jgi:hypothetical protein
MAAALVTTLPADGTPHLRFTRAATDDRGALETTVAPVSLRLVRAISEAD